MTTLAKLPKEALSIPGADFGRNALRISPDSTPKQLGLIGDFLSCVTDSAEWWRADYIKALAERDQLKDHAKARATCLEHGIEQGTFEFFLSIADMFPPSVRTEGLSFDHHREAVIGTNGSPLEARQWLAKAQAEGWTVPELRKALRQANATYHQDGRKPTGNGYSALVDAERWARTQEKEIKSYTPERAQAILSDIKHLRTLIDTLESIAQTV